MGRSFPAFVYNYTHGGNGDSPFGGGNGDRPTHGGNGDRPTHRGNGDTRGACRIHDDQKIVEKVISNGVKKKFGEKTVRSTLDPDGQMNTWPRTTCSHFELDRECVVSCPDLYLESVHVHNMTFDPKIISFPCLLKIRPANPSNKKLNLSGLM